MSDTLIAEGQRHFYPDACKLPEGITRTAEALNKVGLDWEVEMRQMKDENGVPATYAGGGKVMRMVRTTDGKTMGVATEIYKPINNVPAFAVCDILAEQGKASFVAAGTAKHETLVWAQMQLTRELTIAGDPIMPYLLFVNSHRGDRSMRVGTTPERFFCTNQLPFLGANERFHSIRHTGDTEEKLAEARIIVGEADQYYGKFEALGNALALRRVSPKELQRWVEKLYPSGKTDKAATDAKEKQNRVLDMIKTSVNLEDHRTNAWGFVNAVAEIADWGTGRDRDRMYRVAADKDADAKNKALAIASQGLKLSMN